MKIIPIRIFKHGAKHSCGGSPFSDKYIAKSIGKAWDDFGADILSNSWGGGAPDNIISDAIQIARANGRNNKGSVVIFAAGNTYSGVDFPGNTPGVISVGAIDLTGFKFSYSASGPELSMTAPSGMVNLQGNIRTIDRMGDDGFNPYVSSGDLSDYNYTSKFGGTSAAAPEAAGVAALLLSIDPS